jgi:hypothetical protein
MSKTRMITMNKINLNGALLKSGLTMLVLSGTMFAAPVAHSADYVDSCRATDSCTAAASKPLYVGRIKVTAECTLDGKPSYGTLRIKTILSGSRDYYFRQPTFTVEFAAFFLKRDYVSAQVLCDYRHDRNPRAFAAISWG